MGKITISMVIFHSYIKLPEGRQEPLENQVIVHVEPGIYINGIWMNIVFVYIVIGIYGYPDFAELCVCSCPEYLLRAYKWNMKGIIYIYGIMS